MNIVRESINEGKGDKLALAAGLVILYQRKILLVHPTGASWWGTYSIPKGHIDVGEDLIDAAIRETEEETGLKDQKDFKVLDRKPDKFIDYTKAGEVYKRVYYFPAKATRGLKKTDFKLQKKEADWAGFLSFEDAWKRIMPRFRPIIKKYIS